MISVNTLQKCCHSILVALVNNFPYVHVFSTTNVKEPKE
jgi:hypothetical protein